MGERATLARKNVAFPIDYFFSAARRWPDEPALIAGDRKVTFAALCEQVEAVAWGLLSRDPTRRSRVAICAENGFQHVVALLATLAAGKTWVPLSTRHGRVQLERIVSFTEPSIVIVDAALAGSFDTRNAAVVICDDPAETGDTLAALAKRHRGEAPPPLAGSLDETQAIKFTGGTTGAPKGVMQPYRAWNATIATMSDCFKLSQSDRYLVATPLSHGSSTFVLPLLAAGGSLAFPAQAKAPSILESIGKERATLVFMPPTLIYSVVAEQTSRPRDLSSLRFVIYSAAPMPPEKITEARAALGEVIATTYGQTEAPIIATFMGPPDFRDPANLASVGAATLMTEVAILADDQRKLLPGETGEIAIRGDLVMSGYWKMPDKTAETIRDGWLRTGDLGLLDRRGYLYLRGRSRDVIITGGFNVYPTDVEDVLGRHPAVYDCAIVGIEDEKWGEAVHAAVQAREGHAVDERAVIAFVRSALGPVMTPKSVHVFDRLPHNNLGKVIKDDVRAEIRSRLAMPGRTGGSN